MSGRIVILGGDSLAGRELIERLEAAGLGGDLHLVSTDAELASLSVSAGELRAHTFFLQRIRQIIRGWDVRLEECHLRQELLNVVGEQRPRQGNPVACLELTQRLVRLQRGARDAMPLIENDHPTLASFLKKEGYQTHMVGKWHLGLGWARHEDGKVNYQGGLAS